MEAQARTSEMIDLFSYFNNDGISYDTDRSNGDFDGNGKTFPAEDLPDSRSVVSYYGVDFLFPDKSDGKMNNITLEHQSIHVPPGNYQKIYVLGVSEGGSFEESVMLRYADHGSERAALGLSSWHRGYKLIYGESIAIRSFGLHAHGKEFLTDELGVIYGIWFQSLRVDPQRKLVEIGLPDNPCMHIFAMTLRPVQNKFTWHCQKRNENRGDHSSPQPPDKETRRHGDAEKKRRGERDLPISLSGE